MRILQVITSIDAKGGGPIEALVNQNKFFADSGCSVDTLSLDRPGNANHVGLAPVTTHLLGGGGGNYRYSRRLDLWLRANIERYDLVIVHGLWQYHGYAIWKASKEFDIPYLVYPHGMLAPWFKKQYRLKHIKKWIYWLLVEYRVIRDARLVLFTSEAEMILARESFRLYSAHERVVGLGIDNKPKSARGSRNEFISRFSFLEGRQIILFMSRIHVVKGCDMLIEAFAIEARFNEGIHLVIAGAGDAILISQLKAQALRLGIADRVAFVGMLVGDLKWGAFDAADVLVLPSHQENFGVVVAEALSCSLPVLITDKVNIHSQIEQDEAGIVQPDTQSGINRLLNTWLHLTPLQREMMRVSALNCFNKNYRADKNMIQLLRTLSGLISTSHT